MVLVFDTVLRSHSFSVFHTVLSTLSHPSIDYWLRLEECSQESPGKHPMWPRPKPWPDACAKLRLVLFLAFAMALSRKFQAPCSTFDGQGSRPDQCGSTVMCINGLIHIRWKLARKDAFSLSVLRGHGKVFWAWEIPHFSLAMSLCPNLSMQWEGILCLH